MRRALGVLLALAFGLSSGCAPRPSGREAEPEEAPIALASSAALAAIGRAELSSSAALGNGFLVWESNRSRNWRIWTRELAPSEPRRLTPEEGTRQHCCPHISPDGSWIAYLSFPDAMAGYAAGGSEGTLHLIRPDGSGDRIVTDEARSSWESRAAVWRSGDELIYIRGDRATVLHDLRDGRTTVLANGPTDPSGRTWLINSRLSHAVSGAADFSAYSRTGAGGAIATGRTYGGCQPYFSHDGRWGFWAAGTGGPLNRVDLSTGQVSTILSKSDPRIPDGLGYAYFPMFSRDGYLFAFAASDYEHNHFLADYEIFVAASDPDSLELLGDAVRMTSHPATDRFPDVFLQPLPLGRFQGEAPFGVELRSPEVTAAATWDFGDGTSGRGPTGKHTFEQPGSYLVSARPAGTAGAVLHGQVAVKPASAPRPLGVRSRHEGRSVVVEFDEEIAADRPRLRFESGVGVAGWSVGAEGRSLIIEPAIRIDGFDRLYLEGVSDRAQRPNWIEPLVLDVEPPLWPSDRRGLAFLWETGDAANLVWDASLAAERATSLAASGRAFLDHDFAMALEGGRFAASAADAGSILEACRRSNEFSLEAVILPSVATAAGPGKIISFSGGTPQSRNFVLEQRGDRLLFSPRAGNPALDAYPDLEIGRVAAGTRSHVLIAQEVGRLVAYVNGKAILETEAVQGGLFHWKPRPLLFGDGPRGGNSWRGRLEGVAVYSRFIGADEARENFLRYRSQLAARRPVPRLVVDATLVARSEAPSLQEITPYREALAVFAYRVERVVEGSAPGGRLRVAHWSILDGEILESNREPPIGGRLRLNLEPFADNPQLESLYVADTLEPGAGPLFYAFRP